MGGVTRGKVVLGGTRKQPEQSQEEQASEQHAPWFCSGSGLKRTSLSDERCLGRVNQINPFPSKLLLSQ